MMRIERGGERAGELGEHSKNPTMHVFVTSSLFFTDCF